MGIPLIMAKEQELIQMGLAPTPPERLGSRLLDEVRHMLSFSRALPVMLESCTKCGACAKACHSYLGTGDVSNIPAVRADLLRVFYQKNFTTPGRLMAVLTGEPVLGSREIERWVDYAYQCTMCRRCAYYCPMGIDTTEITMAMRYILAKLGIVPHFIAGIAANEIKAGNNARILKPAIIDCCEFLEGELKEETGRDIKIPLDKPGSDILYIPSSTELLHNADTLIGVAKMFHMLGLNWTMSSILTEAANYGMFIDLDLMKYHHKRMINAARQVGAALVVQGECGHGWRVAKMFSEGANGAIPFKIMHILELAAQNLDRLPLKKIEMRVTLHDTCNYARSGDLAEAPRRILQACVTDVAEMTPNRELNYCCGGGSGLLMEEMMEVRMKLAKMKAEQMRALGPLDAVVAPCAACKAQFPHIIKHYELGSDTTKVSGVMEIMGAALQL
jgi:Fe-S oxidoreductase